MFFQADSPDTPSRLQSDICIVGGGPAGITLALALAESGKDVLLLEGGGFELPSEQESSVYDGEAVYKPYLVNQSRLRFFGGTSNHWGGWCRPLDRTDFERGDRGWPIAYDSMLPFYRTANDLCEIGKYGYEADMVSNSENIKLIDWSADDPFQNKIFRHSPPTRFGERYRQDIADAASIRCILGANLVGITSSGSSVKSLQVRTFSGRELTVESKAFVLAMGGIENARLLLHTGDGPGTEIGNHSGYLGRCFADHFGYTPGVATAAAGLTYELTQVDGMGVTPIISPSDRMDGPYGPFNCAILLHPIREGELVNARYMSNSFVGPRQSGDPAASWTYRTIFICEPSPNPDSTITLSDEKDILGLRRVRLDWRISTGDYDKASHVARSLATTLGARGLGRMQYTKLYDPDVKFSATGGLHHMGTTRMSDDPRYGVVDADCRIHHTDNLYVAGSSVFPTCSFANPTLTIVALAQRLAKTLETRV